MMEGQGGVALSLSRKRPAACGLATLNSPPPPQVVTYYHYRSCDSDLPLQKNPQFFRLPREPLLYSSLAAISPRVKRSLTLRETVASPEHPFRQWFRPNGSRRWRKNCQFSRFGSSELQSLQ